ncbi:hypothetical protein G8B17_07420 [Limosilactobacillus mucosae]|nr:hypothetical protein G8B17_07420 [Limosilactobacillus mucosae]
MAEFLSTAEALDANQRRLYFKRLCHGITPMAEPFLIAFKNCPCNFGK